MRVAFVNYSYPQGFDSPAAWIDRIKPVALVMEALSNKCATAYIGHIDYTGNHKQNGVEYFFTKPTSKKNLFPKQIHAQAEAWRPDVVIVAGLHFPMQLIQLKRKLGKKTKLLVRHHGDKPWTGLKKKLQQLADKYVDAYLFTSSGIASEWISKGNIKKAGKILELPEGTTAFSRLGKQQSRKALELATGLIFLWVGRLNDNKDPLTVLTAFENYLAIQPAAKLYMIYQDADLLPAINKKLGAYETLKKAVVLKGFVPAAELPTWYSAADFFILGSHHEATGFALIEAMACGCIPVVTAIPSFLKAVDSGKYGLLYQPGNAEELFKKLSETNRISIEKFSAEVEQHFHQQLSADAIAAKLFQYCRELIAK